MRMRLALAALCLLAGCAEVRAPERLELAPTTFAALQGWQDDQQAQALSAFQKSCAALTKKNPDATFVVAQAGRAADWQNVCAHGGLLVDATDKSARAFFEANFTPYTVLQKEPELFTGYYEAQLNGAWQRGGAFQTPLYARPKDMLTIDLGAFRDSWAGEKITGKITGTSFVPYDERALVAQGSLDRRAEPLLWVDDSVGAFFLEVQGSGQIRMQDGEIVRVGYGAQNGHGYTAIGRVLADRGELERPVTMQKIRAWLAAHPATAQDVMNTNPSVVFFRKLSGEGPVGAQGVVLTPLRSLAVDPKFVPLGAPLWLMTQNQKRLVVAQDTGGAIKGAVRGDLFWGAGEAAETGAGAMQDKGTYVLLLPKSVGSR